MSHIDEDWAVAEIDAFLCVTEQVTPATAPDIVYFGTTMRGPRLEADERAYVVEQILDKVLPNWQQGRPDSDDDYVWLRQQSARTRAALRRQQEIHEKLGEGSPRVTITHFHPWVWDGARSLWLSGHFGPAVIEASKRVNVETQAKTGRVDVSETALFNEVFSLDPPKPNRPRLRLHPQDGSKTYENLHRGARAFAEGLYSAVRNPAAHGFEPTVGEQDALEQLSAFSLLARWVDVADLNEVQA